MDKNRFLKVLRWELLLSRRQIVIMALALFALVVIPQMLTLTFKSTSSSAYTTGILSSVALIAYFLCSGALIFSSLRSRQQRINNFMLPASNGEKFVARYLVLAVAMPLAAIVGFFAGDVLQFLVSLMINNNAAQWASGIFSTFWDQILNNGVSPIYADLNGEPAPVRGFLVILLGAVTQHACFLLFGSIFHKHPLVMAILMWIAIGIALLTLAGLGAYLLTDFLDSGYTIILYDAWWKALGYIASIAFIVFCYWFAFRRYTRLQVINNRWINK